MEDDELIGGDAEPGAVWKMLGEGGVRERAGGCPEALGPCPHEQATVSDWDTLERRQRRLEDE